MKNRKWLFRMAALLMVMSVLLSACKTQAPQTQEPTAAPYTQYTVTVKTDDGKAVPGVSVLVYIGDENGEMVGFDNTDENGTMTFGTPKNDNLVAVLQGIPTGYTAEKSYPITGETTEIILSVGKLTEDDLNNVVYKLGDKALDFTVTDVTGAEHTLSELLKTKKAVVLHFWYMPCEPCDREFPGLQKAYAAYQNDIAVLGLNPEPNQNAEEVLAYLEDMGITFPLALVEEQWKSMMSIEGYPTTVVIDREGNICLIQSGSLESADTFSQIFDYFIAENYESKPIESLDEIVTESTLGTLTNPHETDAAKAFEITVKPGETYYLHLYKQVEKFYLSVSGGSFSLRYKNKDYPAEGNSLTLYVKPEGAFVPVELEITNTSDKEQTYTVSKANPRGSYSNPYSLSLGEFDAKVPAGNEQGVYYTYYMPEDGTLRITCLQSTSGIDYDFTLYNLNSYAQHTLEGAGTTDEEGRAYLEIQGRKGQKIQFILNTVPDSTNSYPACSFKLLAEVNAGQIEEKYEPPKTVYTVTVTDQDGAPMQDVSLLFAGDFVHTRPTEEETEGTEGTEGQEPAEPETYPIQVSMTLKTDENGVATTEQVSGPYTVTVTLPEGYKAEVTKYDLTAEAPQTAITLKKIIQKDYTVTLQYPDGTPLVGANIMLGSAYKATDDTGNVCFNLDEGQYSITVLSGVPEGYVLPENETTFQFPENESTLTLTLVGVGGKENPYIVDSLPFATRILAAQETVYLRLTAQLEYADSPTLTVEGGASAVAVGEQLYTSTEGVTTIALTETVENLLIAVTNRGDEASALTLKVTYPVGTKHNPEVLTSLENVTLTAPEGSANGYYYQYVHENAGHLTLQLAAVPAGFAVTATTATDGTVDLTDAAVTVYQKIDEATILHIQAEPVVSEETTAYPAATATLNGSFAIDWDAVPEGQQVYTVTVQKPDGKGMENVMVQILKNGTLVSYGLSDSQGQYKAMLDTAVYNVELSLPESTTKYYYDKGGYSFALGSFELTVPLVTKLPGTPTSNFMGSWNVGAAAPVRPGTYYVSLQSDAWKYFLFTAPKAGTYRISVSDPNALLCYCGADYYPSQGSAEEAVKEYNLSIQKDQYQNTKYVFAVSGTEDTLLTITRIGDPEFNPSYTEPDTKWCEEYAYTPKASDIPKNVSNPVYVDIKDQTPGKYNPVFNETDGFYHMGSKDGPIIYLNLNDSGAPYASLKVAVCGEEGSPAGGTAFSRYFYDSVTGKFIKREEYGNCIREYVEVLREAKCYDRGTAFYPLTHNLAYILQNGCAKWWESEKELYYESFQGYNPDIVWLFACCTFE